MVPPLSHHEPFQPLQPRRSSERIAEALRDTIVAGRFSPGERLPPERTLAGQFGVTRNTVREALRRLEQYRLVSIRQGSGVTVRDHLRHAGIELLGILVSAEKSPGPTLVEDLLEARAVLGEVIVTHAAARAPTRELGAFARAIDALEAEAQRPRPRVEVLLDLDFDVHRALVQAGGNLAFTLFLNTLRSIYTPVAHLFAPVVAQPTRLVRQYREALALLQQGERRGAERIFRQVFQAGLPARSRRKGGTR